MALSLVVFWTVNCIESNKSRKRKKETKRKKGGREGRKEGKRHREKVRGRHREEHRKLVTDLIEKSHLTFTPSAVALFSSQRRTWPGHHESRNQGGE